MSLQVKQGSFALNNATGNQVVSWATGGNWPSSATPKLVLFLATGQTADGTAQHGIGMLGAAASSTQRWVLSQASDDAAAAVNSGQSARTNACIVLLSNGTPTPQAVADFVSFGAEQFTINVTTAPGVTGIQIGYIAFGGADLTDVAVGSSTIPTVTGNQAITPTGFTGKTPDCILTTVPYQPASPTESTFSHFGLGWATRLPSTAQGVAAMMEADNSAAIDTQRIFLTNMCVAGAEAAIAGHVRGSLGSWDANGFTVNWADAAAAANNIWLYVAIKGGGWQCFSDTEATTNTSKATAVSGFGADTPKGLLLIGSNGTADTASTDTANGDCLIALGASDGTTEFAVANIQVNGSATGANSLAKRRLAATKAISLVKTPTTTSPWATVCGEADATFQAGQVTLTWAGTDGTARKFLGLAVGDNFPAPVGYQYVGGATDGGAATTTRTIAYNPATAGNTLVLAVNTVYSTTGSIVTPTSTPAETWLPLTAEVTNANGNGQRMYYANNIVGGSYSITYGTGGGVSSLSAALAEYSGLADATPLDQTASGTSATGTATSQSATTGVLSEQPQAVIVGMFADACGTSTFTAGSGFTKRVQLTTTIPVGIEDKRVTSTAAATGDFTASLACYLTAIVGTFKEAASGPATQTLALAGAGSGAAVGVATALPGPVTVAVVGALSAEVAGQPATTPAYTVPLAGAGTAEAAGQSALSAAYTAALSGAASGERSGQPIALPGAVAVLPAGAASGEAAGRAAVAVLTALTLAGAASGEAAGVPTLLPGGVTMALAGASSAEAGGQPAVGVFTFVALAGAGSGERAGQLAAFPGGLTLPLVGAASGEAAGPALVSIGAVTLTLAGVGSGERAGALLALPGVVALLPAGAASGELAGQVALSAPAPNLTVAPGGAGSGERAGATIALPGVALLTPAGVGGVEAAGVVLALPGGVALPLAGAGTGEQRGTVTLSTLVALALAGVGSGERAGVGLVVPGAVTLGLVGAASGEVAGVLTIGGIAIPFFVFVAKPQHEGFGAGGELFVFLARTQGQGG